MQIIDQLADLLNRSPRVPLSSNRLVDANEIGQLLERLRISVPSSIMESERTLAERERILNEADTEAKRIVAQARQRANEMLSADALVAMARREAQKIVEDGHNTARQRSEEADQYAAHVLGDLAANLGKMAKQVENGLQMLQEQRQAKRQEAPAPAHAPTAPAQARGEPKG